VLGLTRMGRYLVNAIGTLCVTHSRRTPLRGTECECAVVVAPAGTVEGRRYLHAMSMPAVGDAARAARSLLAGGPVSSEDLWRFGVLQLLDDYESVRARIGVSAAASLMADEPGPTDHLGLDAAFAGLACWLADRDQWSAPAWALAEDRVARPWWFVSSSAYGRAWAMRESPGQFRIRGVFITGTALTRV
jgi:hypothetical protein